MKFVRLFLVTCSLLASVSTFAEIVKLKTTNGVFEFPRENIVNGPNGFLKTLFNNEAALGASRQEDGTYFVSVDAESMRVALGFIRSGRMDEVASKKALMKTDIDFLFPGLDVSGVTRKTIWKCSALCAIKNGDKYFDYLIPQPGSKHTNIFNAWANLIEECARAAGVSRSGYLIRTHTFSHAIVSGVALASMTESCVPNGVED